MIFKSKQYLHCEIQNCFHVLEIPADHDIPLIPWVQEHHWMYRPEQNVTICPECVDKAFLHCESTGIIKYKTDPICELA